MPDVWQVRVQSLGWRLSRPRNAVEFMTKGYPIRLRSLTEAAMDHAYAVLKVEPWVIKAGLQKAGGTKARALIGLCLRASGRTERQIAEALGVAQSSIHDLMDKYRRKPEVQEGLRQWIEWTQYLVKGTA